MNVNLPAKKYPDQPGRQALFDSLLNHLRDQTGVKASGGVFGLPLSGSIEGRDIELAGAPPQKPGELLTADYAQVSPGYFQAMNIPLVLVGYFQKGKLMFAGKVQQGLTPSIRAALLKGLDYFRTAKCPFANLPTTKSGHWGEGVTAEEMGRLRLAAARSGGGDKVCRVDAW